MDIRNILVIRSATRVLNQTLAALKKEFPQARVTVIAPLQAQDALELDPLVDDVICVNGNGRMSLFNFGLKKIRDLRQRKFDLAVSLYNIDHGLGYSNVDLLTWASNAPVRRGYNPQGKFVSLTPPGIIKKYFLEKTSVAWVAVNYAATAVLFSLITLGLLAEWLFRKMSGGRESEAREKTAALDRLPAVKNQAN
ncbi:MAG: hypothetical protein HY579_02105 [Nitrospinae bacterium]|nr:hypothetical protein [Nitrospinota bacterium]